MKIVSFFLALQIICFQFTICPLTSLVKPPTNIGPSSQGNNQQSSNTVNVISQNAIEAGQDETQSFLDRLERRETISHIRKAIDHLGGKLKDIQVNVRNRLNQINASGRIFVFF